jgi:hypothetical protein
MSTDASSVTNGVIAMQLELHTSGDGDGPLNNSKLGTRRVIATGDSRMSRERESQQIWQRHMNPHYNNNTKNNAE